LPAFDTDTDETFSVGAVLELLQVAKAPYGSTAYSVGTYWLNDDAIFDHLCQVEFDD
jgi:hypothetical protein